MSRRFQVGDRVEIIGCLMHRRHVGKVTKIVEYCPETSVGMDGWYVDLPTTTHNTNGYALFLEAHLRLAYDGNEKVAWSSCEWQPRKVRA